MAKRKRKGKGVVTQRDIARLAKCSQNTVALALRGSTRISEARRREIHEIARKMGYRPNLAARSLRRGRSGLIGVFTGVLDNPRTAFVRAMLSQLHSTRYKPILGSDDEATKPWYEAPWIQTFQELQVEAMVSFAWHDVPCLPDWHQQVPIIMSGNEPCPDLPCDAVSVARAGSSQLAVDYLRGRGHQRIALLQPHETWEYASGFREAMAKADLEPLVSTRGKEETGPAHGRRFLDEIGKAKDPPTAVFVIDSVRAADLCAMALDAGLRIPEDIAVLGCGYMPWAGKLRVPLTTVERPIEEMVAATTEIIRNRLASPGSPPIQLQLPYRIMGRISA